jgi:hypothetical protein
MSTAGDLFSVVKRIILVNEEMSRLTAEVHRLSQMVDEHDRRLIRIETLLEVAGKRSRLILPGQ